MKRKHLRFGEGVRITVGNKRSQPAEMVLAGSYQRRRPAAARP